MERCRGRNGIPAGFMDPVGVAVFNIWDGFVYAFLEERLRNRVLVRLRSTCSPLLPSLPCRS